MVMLFKGLIRDLFTKHTDIIGDKFKYYFFIICYPVNIIWGIYSLFTHNDNLSLYTKLAGFIFCLVMIPIVFRLSIIVSFFQEREIAKRKDSTGLLSRSAETLEDGNVFLKKLKVIPWLFGPVGTTTTAKVIYIIGVGSILLIFVVISLSSIIDKDYLGILMIFIIMLIWTLIFRTKYKQYFGDNN